MFLKINSLTIRATPNNKAALESIGTDNNFVKTSNPLNENVSFSNNLSVSLSANISLPNMIINGISKIGNKELFSFNNLIDNQKKEA